MTTPSIELRRLLRRTFISQNFPAGSTARDIARACAEALAVDGLKAGDIGIGDEVPTVPTMRGGVLHGNVQNVLADWGLEYVIDHNCIHIRTAEPIDPEDLIERVVLEVVKRSQNMSRSAVAGPPAPRRKGPVPGTTNKVTQARRALFPKIDHLLKSGGDIRSATAAVTMLAEPLPGVGTPESRRAELVKAYNKRLR